VQAASATVGAVFGLVVLLSFIPGPTIHLADLGVAGHPTATLLFGVFAVSVVHNVINLGYAAGGLALAGSTRTARWYLLAGGVLNLLLAGLGRTAVADWIPLNTADVWLHLVPGVGMLGLSLLPPHRR
jgi:hypothetical protein